jgi:hypothetical protein
VNIKKFGGIEGGVTLCVDKEGFEHVVVVAKATFNIDMNGSCTLAAQQCRVTEADEHYGDPVTSSVRYECDFALTKPEVDVVVNGSAHAPGGKPVTEVVVGLELGSIRKRIRVVGDRVWERALVGCKPSSPRAFVTIPVVYERAFGGTDVAPEDPRKHVHEPRNLAGVGYFAHWRPDVLGTTVANLEHPDHPIKNCAERSVPIGFGFISRHWQPRVSHAGTYDRAWRTKQFPYLPADFCDLYNQGAPVDQRCHHLQGGEQVALIHMTPEGRLEFAVPRLQMSIALRMRSSYVQMAPRLDTFIIEPDSRRCILVWRANIALTAKLTDILEVWVGPASGGRLRAMCSDKRYINRNEVVK